MENREQFKCNHQFEYFTLTKDRDGDTNVYGWGTYEKHSVLAGQPKKVFLDSFQTEESAIACYPSANWSSKWTEPLISLNHLPDDGESFYNDDGEGSW